MAAWALIPLATRRARVALVLALAGLADLLTLALIKGV
jgi:hypothetical protein